MIGGQVERRREGDIKLDLLTSYRPVAQGRLIRLRVNPRIDTIGSRKAGSE